MGASVEVWPATTVYWGGGQERKDYLCRKEIGPIPAGEALSVKCYRPLLVSNGAI